MSWLLTCILSIAHLSIQGRVQDLIYLLIISIIVATLVLFIFLTFIKKYYPLLNENKLNLVIIIFILLLTWLDLNKSLPEYKEIRSFEENRSDLVYRMGMKEGDADRKLALLYLNASPVILRIEKSVNHKGAMILSQILEEKIKEGKGKEYVNDIYNLAEVSFTSTGHDFSHYWYKRAFEYGKKNALERFKLRLQEIGIQTSTKD